MQNKLINRTVQPLFTALFSISVLFASGCSNQTAHTPATGQPGDISVQQANDLLKQGKKREAAETYFRIAASYQSPQRERVILQAAEISASMGDEATTQRYLSAIPANTLEGENQGRYDYVKALLAIQQNKPDLALRSLPTAMESLSPALREKALNIRSRAIAMGGKPPIGKATTAGGSNRAKIQASMIPTATNQIAVLLPQSGPLAGVSQDIIQGIQAARGSLGGNTTVKVYDVSQGGAVAHYQRAVEDGADIIIGPLDKESLAELLAQPQILSKPILSLNYLTSTRNVPGALYQFGLLPEDEARQAAGFALARGQKTAIVLAPNSSWGERVGSAFRASYQNGGGRVIVNQQYADTGSADYSNTVQAALNSSQGQAGMVFLAASPTQARAIKPLISAQASNLPVYATSHVFSGRTDPKKDAGLDGIIYTEIPWVIEGLQSGSLNNSTYPRMYALGMDSFLIAKNLPNIARDPNAHVNGKTGSITLAGNRHIERTLLLATFANGVPRPLGR